MRLTRSWSASIAATVPTALWESIPVFTTRWGRAVLQAVRRSLVSLARGTLVRSGRPSASVRNETLHAPAEERLSAWKERERDQEGARNHHAPQAFDEPAGRGGRTA